MLAAGRRLAGAVLVFLIGLGFEVSPIEDIRISIGIWLVCGLFILLLLGTWPPIQQRLPILNRYGPSQEGQELKVWRQLDSACIYVVKTQREVETFSPPPDAPGNYGPLSNPEARRAFAKLQELGVIEPTGVFDERGNIVYRWTDLGRKVKRL
jgi:hypothetical protein